jgi:23S rRNA (guanosine2251-2'-O)-methyltransferase
VIEEGSTIEDWKNFDSIITLDGITDTGNLGAILRSALLFGFEAVVLPNDNSARITPQTIRSSAGALYKVKIIYVNNLNTFIEEAKAEAFTVYGLAGEAKDAIQKLEFAKKSLLVIGSEREGMRKSVKHNCDHLVQIPTTRKINSLNASVAAAIAMWEVFRSR